MPLFSYECEDCHKEFELLVGMTMEKSKFECPECHSKNITKLIASSVYIKNEGFSGGSCSTGSCSLPRG